MYSWLYLNTYFTLVNELLLSNVNASLLGGEMAKHGNKRCDVDNNLFLTFKSHFSKDTLKHLQTTS